MELIQKQVHYTQEGKRTFDQFYLDEDLNVPDTKDDVKQIIQGTASAKVEEIRLTENYLRISGKLYYQILYMTDSAEPQPAALEGKLPFEEMVYMDSGEMTEYFIQNIRVEFTSTLVHSRKLSIRAMVEMEIGREKLEDEATVKRLRRVKGHIRLMPENPNYQPIDGDNAQILGLVVAVYREYRY